MTDIKEESICIIDKMGNRFWYLDDKLHRLDGPAKEWASGGEIWYANGELHRLDGPAIKSSALELSEWWVRGMYIGRTQ